MDYQVPAHCKMVKVINEVKAAMNDTGRSLAAIQTYHHENNIEMVSSELMTARQQLNVNLHQVINDLADIKIKLSQDYKKQKKINKRKQSLENAKIVSPSAPTSVTFTPISPHISAKVVWELFPDDVVSDLEPTSQLELIASSLIPPAAMALPHCLHDDVFDVESQV